MLNFITTIFQSILLYPPILNILYFTYRSIICQNCNNKLFLNIKQVLETSHNFYIKSIGLFGVTLNLYIEIVVKIIAS